MIVVEPLGGLGNQLFVYGLGLAVSRRLGVPLVADLGRIQHDKKRRYELPSFRNSLSPLEVAVPGPGGPGFHLHRILRSKLGGPGHYRNFYYETREGFDSRFLDVPDGSRLRGYFQSWRYVDTVATELREELWEVRNPSPWFHEQRSRLSALDNWVGVHVRRGDYKDLAGMAVGEIYYERALALLSELGLLQNIVVFSDEIELAQQMSLWRQMPNVTFCDSPPETQPIETLLLMSLASHLVIANSTFSWWAAWAGERPGRRVIFPQPWRTSADETGDLIPPGWVGLSREPDVLSPGPQPV
jgi:Glycosyl transferase family 11